MIAATMQSVLQILTTPLTTLSMSITLDKSLTSKLAKAIVVLALAGIVSLDLASVIGDGESRTVLGWALVGIGTYATGPMMKSFVMINVSCQRDGED